MPRTVIEAMVLFTLFSGLLSCHKSDVDPQLPPETMTGQHTYGCLVNGKVWLPGGSIQWGRGSIEMSYDPSYGGVLAIVALYNKGERAISFKKNGINKAGTYSFVADTSAGILYRDEGLPSTCVEFLGGTRYQKITQGQLTITRLDLSGRVIAGRFSFVLAQPGCDTIRITEGRFDMPLQ